MPQFPAYKTGIRIIPTVNGLGFVPRPSIANCPMLVVNGSDFAPGSLVVATEEAVDLFPTEWCFQLFSLLLSCSAAESLNLLTIKQLFP